MIVGRLVTMCIKLDENLETLTLKDFRAVSDAFEDDIYDALDLRTCVNGRNVRGGPAAVEVERQINKLREFIAERRTKND